MRCSAGGPSHIIYAVATAAITTMADLAAAAPLVTDALHRALATGLGLVPPSREPGSLLHVPISLVPRAVS